MTDIIRRMRDAYTVYGVCDFDTLENDPGLRANEMWQDVVLASDAVDEIRRVRLLLQRARTMLQNYYEDDMSDTDWIVREVIDDIDRELATDKASVTTV